MNMNTYQEQLPTKLLKIAERFYGRTFYTSQADIERADKLGFSMICCRCRNGWLVSHHHADVGWHGRPVPVFHRSYLDGATIEEVDVIQGEAGYD